MVTLQRDTFVKLQPITPPFDDNALIIGMDNNNDIVQRIKRLMEDGHYNQSEFAQKIKMNASNLSKHLNGKLAVSEALLNRLVINLGVSKQWLTDGIGSAYTQPATTAPAVPVIHTTADQVISANDINSAQTAGASAKSAMIKQGAPIYDVDVTAGQSSRSMLFEEENIIGYIKLPSIPSDCHIFRVTGDSMTPVINNGDFLAIREVTNPNLIFWGQIYVLLLDDYRMVKYVRRHSDPSMMILRSANPEYDDIEIKRSDVSKLFIVTNVLRIDSRM